MWKYAPVSTATVKLWALFWVDGFVPTEVGVIITPKSGDVVNINLGDLGHAGGPTKNPVAYELPVSPLNLNVDVDLNRFKFPVESLTVMNPITLDDGVVTLTLMKLAQAIPAGTNPDPSTYIVRYHRKIGPGPFIFSRDLSPGVQKGAPR